VRTKIHLHNSRIWFSYSYACVVRTSVNQHMVRDTPVSRRILNLLRRFEFRCLLHSSGCSHNTAKVVTS